MNAVCICLQNKESKEINACLETVGKLQRQSQGQFDVDQLFLNKHREAPAQLANFTGPLTVSQVPGGLLACSLI